MEDENPRIWFQSGIEPGTIITLDQPVRSQWKIVGKLNEHSTQRSQAEHDHYGGTSIASTKLLCQSSTDPTKKAYMRIVQQIPILNTESLSTEKRPRQATRYTPPELDAYRKLTNSTNTPKLLGYKVTTQDESGLVPNGFLIYLVWEIVPGLRLGAKLGPDPFWRLERSERNKIRSSFLVGVQALMNTGVLSDVSALSSLVWHKESKTVYFLGFQEGNHGQFKGPWIELEWLLMYQLVIAPPHEWNLDLEGVNTSHWRW